MPPSSTRRARSSNSAGTTMSGCTSTGSWPWTWAASILPRADTIDLDELGLTTGKTYNWDFFFCDRQPCAQLAEDQDIDLFQAAAGARGRGGSRQAWRPSAIIKRMGGTGCLRFAGDSMPEVPATNLVYKLWNASGVELEALGDGSFHNGGIVIAPPTSSWTPPRSRTCRPATIASSPTRRPIRKFASRYPSVSNPGPAAWRESGGRKSGLRRGGIMMPSDAPGILPSGECCDVSWRLFNP